MPVKWTRPKKAADSKPKAEAPKGESKPKAEAPKGESKPKGGKPKGKPANAKAAADKKEAK